jgi:hypothetical protein
MQPTTEIETPQGDQRPAPPTGAPQTALAPIPATGLPDQRRVTVEQLAMLPDSERRTNWINALVEAEIARQNYAQDRALARDFATSGQFDDLKGMTTEQAIATAMVKIQLGRAWGFNAADSMRYIYFTNGKPAIENEIVAAKLQQAGYDWNVEWLEEEIQHKGRAAKKCIGCTLWLKRWSAATQKFSPVVGEGGEQVSVSFTQYDADTAMIWEKGKQIPLSEKWNFKSWGRDMYYWRAIGRVKKYHAPHVLRGAVSREEALEMMPTTGLSPDMLPLELQPPPPQAEAPPEPKRRTLRDRLMTQADQPAPVEQETLEGLEVEEEPAQ